MAVYVDPLFNAHCAALPKAKQWCHMFADSEAELHDMAGRIGMRRSWFQNKPGREPHYDLVPSRRAQAVSLGAVEVESTRLYMRMKALKSVAEGE